MTRFRQKARNEITEEALRKAARTGKDVCAILKSMLKAATRRRDRARQRKIETAEKFLGCRNRRKRRSR